MTIGIGFNFGDGQIDNSTIQPTPLADDDYLERYLSERGIETWTDHDESNNSLVSVNAAQNALVLRDCKIYAGSLLAGRLAKRYQYSVLIAAPMMEEIWAVIVLRTLCFRRGNPPPASLEVRYQEIMQKDGLLDQIADGTLVLTDESGNPVRPKNSNIPAHSNLQIDRRYSESQVRVVTGSSDRSTSKLGRKFDRHRELDG